MTAENDHHVLYTNTADRSGTLLIEHGPDRRGQALRAAASIRSGGGTVHKIVEVTPDGLRTVEEPAAEPLDPTHRRS